jgi:hypothetical protein
MGMASGVTIGSSSALIESSGTRMASARRVEDWVL